MLKIKNIKYHRFVLKFRCQGYLNNNKLETFERHKIEDDAQIKKGQELVSLYIIHSVHSYRIRR